MKKLLEKEYNPKKGRKNTSKGGYEKGYYKSRSLVDEPLTAVIQKDSKVMMYLSNFLSATKKVEMSRYDKDSKSHQNIQF